MARVIKNYNQAQDKEIQSYSIDDYIVGSSNFDRIELTIIDETGVIRDIVQLVENTHYFISDDKVLIKPNDILDSLNYGTGNYNLSLEYYRDQLQELVAFPTGRNWREGLQAIEKLPNGNWLAPRSASDQTVVQRLISTNALLSEDVNPNLRHVITEVSTTGTEIRVRLASDRKANIFGPSTLNLPADNEQAILMTEYLRSWYEAIFYTNKNTNVRDIFKLNSNITDYQDLGYNYDYIALLPGNVRIPINNIAFDKVTDPQNITLIIKLNQPVPTTVGQLTEVQLRRLIKQTFQQDVYYISEIPDVDDPGFIPPDLSFLRSSDAPEDVYQNRNDIVESGSTDNSTEAVLEQFVLSDYENLNIDYNKFENHTTFGSAKQKLVNFDYKIREIEKHLNSISQSLVYSGSDVNKRRKNAFEEIAKIKKNFTGYEKFLYHDNQNQSTSSAPGAGLNLAKAAYPIHKYDDTGTEAYNFVLNDHDGFQSVFQTVSPYVNGSMTKLFTGKYRAEDRPFFNYSGSLYLSFFAKGNNVDLTGSTIPFQQYGQLPYNKWFIPEAAYSSNTLVGNVLTGSEYRYFVFEASMSYWAPTGSGVEYVADDGEPESTYDVGLMDDNPENFTLAQNDIKYVVVTNASDSGSLPVVRDTSGTYGDMLTPSIFVNDGILDFDSPRTGSIMPSGDLFPLEFTGSAAQAQTFLTEVKITKNDPREALPFSSLYSTTSSLYTAWYEGALASASAYDADNQFALLNNLPTHYKESADEGELRKFVHMIGEFYDIFQQHISNLTNVHSRKYKQSNSTPHNLLPAIAEGLGWNTISAISSSFADNVGFESSNFFSDETRDATLTAKLATNNQWQKIVNNLIYIYKKRGTMGSIRAILASFGVAPDVLNVMQIGGSNEEQNPATITSKIEKDVEGLTNRKGNTSFILKKDNLPLLNLSDSGSDKPQNFLKADWYTNGAEPDGIEFIMRPAPSLSDTTLLINSGSGANKFWDLKIIASSSDATAGKVQLTLNHTSGSSGSLADSNITIATDFIPNLQNHKLWNVYMTRTSRSFAPVSQSYKIYVATQDDDRITTFVAASSSVDAGSGSFANANYVGSGSVTHDSGSQVSGNLYIGTTLTGSLAEFRTWQYELSASKFKQHVLNYNSVVSNNPDGSDLIQHYRLNERNTGSAQLKDASNNVKKFNLSFSDQPITRLKFDDVPVINYKLSVRTGGDRANMQKIIIDEPKLQKNLNPIDNSFVSPVDTDQRVVNRDIKFVFSVVNAIDDYLVDRIADFNIGDKLRPFDYYSGSYTELITLRNTLMEGVSADINQNIRHTVNTVKEKLEDTLQTNVPAHSKVVIGYEVKNDLLTRPKIKHNKTQVQTGSDAGNLTGSLVITESTAELTASFDPVETGSLFITESIVLSTVFDPVETGSIHITESLFPTASFDPVETGSLFITESVVLTSDFNVTKTGSLFITESVVVQSFYSSSKLGALDLIIESASVSASTSRSIYIQADIISHGENLMPSGNINQIQTYGLQSIPALSRSLNRGTGSHLVVYDRKESGSLGDFNVGHDNSNVINYYIGDYEHVSGTVNIVSGSDGQTGWYGGYGFDYTDYRNFFNQRILPDNNYLYDNKYSSSINLIKGRPIGTTLYFTESNGEIIYPSNHAFIVGSSKDFHSKLFYEGTLNDGSQPVDDPRGRDTRSDLAASTASVAGANTLNALYVQRTEDTSEE